MAHMIIWPMDDSQIALQGRKAGSGGGTLTQSGIFGQVLGALGALAGPSQPPGTPGPTDVVVEAIPAVCPECPPTISCAPCNPFACPSLPAGTSWHQWLDTATNKIMCVRPRAASEIPTLTPGSVAWFEAHAVASAVIFSVGVLAIGACVAYSRRHG